MSGGPKGDQKFSICARGNRGSGFGGFLLKGTITRGVCFDTVLFPNQSWLYFEKEGSDFMFTAVYA